MACADDSLRTGSLCLDHKKIYFAVYGVRPICFFNDRMCYAILLYYTL